MMKLIKLKWSGVKAWSVALEEDEIRAVVLDSGWEWWKLFDNEEIDEGEDILIGEGSV